MPYLRCFVLSASLLQITIGAYALLQVCALHELDVLGLIICCMIIIAGVSSLAGLSVNPRRSLSRMATIQLNLILLGLVVTVAAILMLLEHLAGAPATRLSLLATVAALLVSPFLVNCVALGLIERCARRLAWRSGCG